MGKTEVAAATSGYLISRAGSLLLFRVVTIALQSGAAIIAARALGATGRGMLAAALVGPSLVALLLVLGMGVSNVYFVARSEVSVAVALGTSLTAAMVVGVAASLIYIGLAALLRQSVFNGLPMVYLVVGAFAVPISLASRYVTAVAQGLQRINLLNVFAVAQAAGLAVLYLVFLLLLDRGPLVALQIGLLASLLALAPVLVTLTASHGAWRFEREYLSRGIRFGARGEVGNFLAFLGYRLDVLVVTALLGFAAAGQYTVAFAGVELLWVVPNAIGVVLFPRVAAAVASEVEGNIAITAQIARLTTFLLIFFALIGALLAPIVIPVVFSAQYRASVMPLEFLVPGVVLFGTGKVLSADLAGRGHPGIASVASAIGILVMVALDLLLIPSVGLAGAGIASSIGYAVVFVFQARAFNRLTGVRTRSLLVPHRQDLADAYFAVVALLRVRWHRGTGPARSTSSG
jgi:O-antigen/teichoic acid export membrane protein